MYGVVNTRYKTRIQVAARPTLVDVLENIKDCSIWWHVPLVSDSKSFWKRIG